MKSFSPLLLFVPVLLFSQGKDAEQLRMQDLKKFTHQSGQIDYIISGGASGREKLVFQQYGWQSARKQDMMFELYGIKTRQSMYELTDGNFIYRLNEADSTYKDRLDLKWSQQASYKTPEEVSKAILFSIGGNYAADSTLLGKNCQVWTFDGAALKELWIWEGLVLKRKLKLGEHLVVTTANAISIPFAVVDQTIFELPNYFTKENDK